MHITPYVGSLLSKNDKKGILKQPSPQNPSLSTLQFSFPGY